MRAVLLYNPAAGTEDHDKKSIIDALRLANFEAENVTIDGSALECALQEGPDLLVVAGGDGTISRVLARPINHSIPIGLLPLGSANNVARSLGIGGTPQELAEQWRIGHLQPFHLMRIKGSKYQMRCVEGFGVAAIAQLIERRPKGEKASPADDIRRGRAVLGEIIAVAEPLQISVTVEGRPWRKKLISLDILNIPFTGPSLPLAHDADPADKLLNVIGLEENRREEFLAWIRSPHETAPPVTALQGKEVEVCWRNVASRIDDHFFKAESDWQKVVLSCESQPLRILVPTKHPATRGSAKGNEHQLVRT